MKAATYGYKYILIEEHSGRGKHGRPAITGVRAEINQAEAEVVRRIFDLFGSGAYTQVQISRMLNYLGIPSPKSRNNNLNALWAPTGVVSILRNELYRGIILRDGIRIVLHPETGEIEFISRAESEWVIGKSEDIRIVSEEQWEKVERVFQSRKPKASKLKNGHSSRS